MQALAVIGICVTVAAVCATVFVAVTSDDWDWPTSVAGMLAVLLLIALALGVVAEAVVLAS